jgi:hypothetical protein
MISRSWTVIQILAAWLAGFVLASIIIMLGHELLMAFAVNTLDAGMYVIPLIHIAYYCTAGLLWVAFFLIQLEYLKRAAGKGSIWAGTLILIGVQLLLIGFAQAGLTLYGLLPADTAGILLIAAEGSAGTGMLVFARSLKKRTVGGVPANGGTARAPEIKSNKSRKAA